MHAFLEKLRAGVAASGMAGGRVLVAVSGGADSVALLRGLNELQNELALTLVAGHLDHGLRGAESRADAEWVEMLCRSAEVPAILGRIEVPALAAAEGRGIEETARRARYEFLERTAREQGCGLVAVAHTADDQAETILHRILRGTGLAGLRGIPRTRALGEGVRIVRPLLEVDRGTIEEYLRSIDQEFRDDRSNTDAAFTRNRLRHELLPGLRRDFNPQVDEALRRLGRQAAEVQEVLDTLAERLLAAAIVDRADDVCRLRTDVLAEQPRHLVRECFARLWREQRWPLQGMGFDAWDALAALCQNTRAASAGREPGGAHCDRRSLERSDRGAYAPRSPNASFTLPGPVEAAVRGELLILRRR